MSLFDALAGGFIGGILASGNTKTTNSSFKDSSIILKSKKPIIQLKKEIIEKVLELPDVHPDNYDRDLNWNNIIVTKIGNNSIIEIEFYDSEGKTMRTKSDALLIEQICKSKKKLVVK